MKRSLILAMALGASTMLSAPSQALVIAAPDTFLFTGDCSDCDNAVGTLLNYGPTLTSNSFVSFTYSSSRLSFVISQEGLFAAIGDLSGPAGPKPVSIFGFADAYNPIDQTISAGPPVFYSFVSSSDGAFNVEVSRGPTDSTVNFDTGDNHTWAPADVTTNVPEPASWAMMVAGFGLIGGAMRRRVRTTVAFA